MLDQRNNYYKAQKINMSSSFKIFVNRSIGVFSLMLLFACEGDLESMPTGVPVGDVYPDSYSKNFDITYSDSAKLKVNITGIHLEQYTKNGKSQAYDVMKDSVQLKFFNSEGTVSSEMKADYTIRYHETEIMNAKGNVEVINRKGEKLNTERLTWNKKTKKIVCDTTVVITKPSGQKIVGSSLESDQNFENYKITKVTGKLPFEREEAPE